MRRDELAGRLRQPYTPERGFGTARVAKEGYEHIWFVVPPSPPREIPSGLRPGTLGRANAILESRPDTSKASDLDRLIAHPGGAMGQTLHGIAKTTHAVRAAIRRSKAPIQGLSERFDLYPKTVAK